MNVVSDRLSPQSLLTGALMEATCALIVCVASLFLMYILANVVTGWSGRSEDAPSARERPLHDHPYKPQQARRRPPHRLRRLARLLVQYFLGPDVSASRLGPLCNGFERC